MCASSLLIILGLSCAHFSSSSSDALELERFRQTPYGWRKHSEPHPATAFDLTFAVAQTNLEELEAKLLRVSDPDSDEYGQHLSLSQVNGLVAPRAASIRQIESWLRGHGVNVERDLRAATSSKDFLVLRTTVQEAERILDTKFSRFEHALAAGKLLLRTSKAYRVPKAVALHIDFVSPAGRFPHPKYMNPHRIQRVRPKRHKEAGRPNRHLRRQDAKAPPMEEMQLAEELEPLLVKHHSSADGPEASDAWAMQGQPRIHASTRRRTASSWLEPKDMLSYYGVGDIEASGAPSHAQEKFTCSTGPTGQGVISFLHETADLDGDLQEFFEAFMPSSVGQRPVVWEGEDADTATTPAGSSSTIEASLDTEYLMSIGRNVNTMLWAVPGHSPDPLTTQPNNEANEPFLDWLIALSEMECPPAVNSISYADNEDSVSLSYALRVNSEFKKGGVRGITYLFASGDDGVGGAWAEPCKRYNPSFPATSPWVLAVGATTAVLDDGSGVQHQGGLAFQGETRPLESGADISSGGFSTYFDRPMYQHALVEAFLAKESGGPVDDGTGPAEPDVDTSVRNRQGRAYPDVSTLGVEVTVLLNGREEPTTGTSASTPVMAGVISLLNDQRIHADPPKSLLGFVNPVFYAHPEVFNDIVDGSNPGCDSPGFAATTSWDPVTGLGSPNFPKLSKLVNSLK
eukprot:g1450.t1